MCDAVHAAGCVPAAVSLAGMNVPSCRPAAQSPACTLLCCPHCLTRLHWLPADVAVVCLESVADEAERRNLQQKLSQTHTIVDITRAQVTRALCCAGARRVSVFCFHFALELPPVAACSSRTNCVCLQMAALCGNVLELEDGRGLPVMAMSTQAYNAFTEDQKRVLR